MTLLILSVLGCGTIPPPIEAPPMSEKEPDVPPELFDPNELPSFPPMSAGAEPAVMDVEPTFGEPIEREALYVVAPFAMGKNLQSVELVFDDGERWVRSYRPLASEFAYVDKRVLVRGRPYVNSPYVQSVDGTHFELEHIELAEGETPWDPAPTELPAPPQVRTWAELEARQGRWAHCIGTLGAGEPGDRPGWQTVVLRLDDGTELRLSLAAGRSFGHPTQGSPEEFQGQRVTVLGKVSQEAGEFQLVGSMRVCAGEVERCHMTMDSAR